MTKHLVIPDAHAHPDYNNKRFSWLGELVADVKPDHVIMIGDWADMPSLCSYDKWTKGFEGRRYKKDIEAAIDAQERFFKPIKARKKKLPKFWMLEGNHEHRIERATKLEPILDGTIGLGDLQYKDFGWEVIPYRGSTPGQLDLDGVAYAHYFVSGIMGRPIGGVNPAYQLVSKYGHSCTQGHTHTLAFYHRGNAITECNGLVCGVYQDYEADFAGVANSMWWRGAIVKNDVRNGLYDLECINLERIKREYK